MKEDELMVIVKSVNVLPTENVNHYASGGVLEEILEGAPSYTTDDRIYRADKFNGASLAKIANILQKMKVKNPELKKDIIFIEKELMKLWR